VAREVSIRQSLLRNLLFVVLVLAGAILATTVFAAREITRLLSGAVIGQALDATHARLDGYFTPLDRQLSTLAAWGEAGLLDLQDPEALRRLLAPVIRSHPQVAAALVADARGREFMLLRAGQGWLARTVRRDAWQDRVHWLSWSAAAPAAVERWEQSDYDPRERPWFEGALAAEDDASAAETPPASTRSGVYWTEPYTFYTARQPGMTAALAWRDAEGLAHVVALDVLLAEISAFTRGLRLTRRALAFVATETGEVVGLPADPRFQQAAARDDALLRTPEALGIPVLRDAAAAYRTRLAGPGEPFEFQSRGAAWWGGTSRFPLSRTRSLVAGVLVPAADLRGGVAELRLAIAAVTLAVLLIALLRAAALARRFGRPIEALVRQSERIARGDLEPGEAIPTRIGEVHRLAAAQDGMREAVRTLLKVGRDLAAAREIQQRTLPAELPALAGFALAAFSEPAEQTGGDAYDVIALPAPDAGTLTGQAGAERALLLLADAVGHGIGPALSVTQVRAMLRMAARAGLELADVARHLNEQLSQDLPAGRFVTAWLGLLDARSGELTQIAAGQAPLLHYRASSRTVETRDADAPPLGVLSTLPLAPPGTLRLEPGDVFAVLSDGIFEARGPNGAELGVERVAALLARHAAGGVEAVVAALRAELARFTAGAPAADDRTALLIQRLAHAAAPGEARSADPAIQPLRAAPGAAAMLVAR
jgi:serine phosphatase RsbU (regulator of sigma subunit)